ncbi:MAG: hypothetical protein C5B50_08580 [Verrucomicrobia bacterium]|nr:MAG: hypothetical protein C5B50_08580 [Verrucomicrobiota bacterium]
MILAATTGQATETTLEYAVEVSAAVQTAPPQITLSWPQDAMVLPDAYSVYRKRSTDTSWGLAIELPGSTTSWTDKKIKPGTAYEYQVVKHTERFLGYGYIYSGINVPMSEHRGTLLLVVDRTHAAELALELARLQQDLVGDGWSVIRFEVSPTDSVARVKSLIKARHFADPANVNCVFLFGHVPVPYSGNIVPDGHFPAHQGAWPCDGYYGDMDGVWTDCLVNQSTAEDPRNRNVPGDGKFDQSTFPARIKLMVGRVDLSHMPGRQSEGGPPTFPREVELLRNYLNKDHKFRTKAFDLPRRAMLGDYFGARDGEAFAASGWRNFSTFFGATNIISLPRQGTWIPTLSATPCLWAYGCGAGTFTSMEGIGNANSYKDGTTAQVVHADIKAAFALCFGSWLGDWDAEDDMLRSVLALPSYGLASAWSGRPHWFLHHMALGETIGYSARLTQNNGPRGPYHNQLNNGAGQIHIALMGDPTLRMHVVAPPGPLSSQAKGRSINLSWTPSIDSVVGYHVYRATDLEGPFKRLTSTPLTGTNYLDKEGSVAANYMVRAVKLETSASGTYYNPSEGTFLKQFAAPIAGSQIIAQHDTPSH